MKTYSCVYFGAALVATLMMPLVTRMARALHIVDCPGVRKIHHTPIPRVGGLPILVAAFALTVPVLLLNNRIGEACRGIQAQLVVLLAGGLCMFLVGFMDDVRNMSASTKLLCLVLASLALCASGARIERIFVGEWFTLDLGWMAWPFTLLWIAGVSVGMNFIDGLDGLAGGIAAIVCGSIAAIALWSGQAAMAVLMLALLGGLTGFLFYNFHPAKVFMGDGGALFIGFMVGGGSVVCQAKTTALVGIALPGLALGVPLLDAFFTVIRRGIIDRRSVLVAERGHLHHRLLDRGLRQQTVVFIFYAITLASAGLGLSTLVVRGGWKFASLGAGIAFLLLVFGILGGARLRETFRAVKRNRAIAHEAKAEKSHFEDAQLRMREARSFDDWWHTVCFLAAQMEFESVTLSLPNGGGSPTGVTWIPPATQPADERTVEVVLPMLMRGKKTVSEMKVRIGVNGRLEAGGRRAALLGRLVDEHPLPLSADVPVAVATAQPSDAPLGAGQVVAWGNATEDEEPGSEQGLLATSSSHGVALGREQD